MTYALPDFDRSDWIIYDGEILGFEKQWEDGTISLTRTKSSRPFLLQDGSQPDVQWFLTEWASDRLHLESSKVGRLKRPPAREVDPETAKGKRARLVQFVCQTLDRANCPRSDQAIDRVLKEAFTPEIIKKFGNRPPGPTARKWLSRSIVGERTRTSCAPRNGEGKRAPRLDSEVIKLRTDAALYYWADFATTIEDAHAELRTWVDKLNAARAAMHLPAVRSCSIEWLRIRINETENFRTYSAKYGKEAAERRFKAHGTASKAGQFLELGFIDHHTWDNYCAVEEIDDELLPVGRPTVTAVYEESTSCIMSAVLHLTDPSLDNMLDALKEANRPKLIPTKVGTDAGKNEILANIYGKLDTVVPDNAWEFTGSSGQDCFGDVGMSVDWARAGEPQDKSELERFWRFLSLTLARKLPCAVLDIKTMRQLGLNPGKVKAVLASDIRALLAEVVAYWHLRLHRGKGAQPARLWEKGVRKRGGAIPVIRDHNELDQMMGRVVETTLTTSGVTMFGKLLYSDRGKVSDLLDRLAGTSPKGRTDSLGQTARIRVKVKFNPANISLVHVYDHLRCCYVSLPCTDENYVLGLSLKHHEVVQAWTECQNLAFNSPDDRKRARASLNRAIRERAPQLGMRQKKKFAALVESGAGDTLVGGVAIAHSPSSYSGMAPTIGHDTAVATRSDRGQIPKAPSPRKGKPSQSAASRTRKTAPPQATTGNSADFRLITTAAAVPGGGDWSGLS